MYQDPCQPDKRPTMAALPPSPRCPFDGRCLTGGVPPPPLQNHAAWKTRALLLSRGVPARKASPRAAHAHPGAARTDRKPPRLCARRGGWRLRQAFFLGVRGGETTPIAQAPGTSTELTRSAGKKRKERTKKKEGDGPAVDLRRRKLHGDFTLQTCMRQIWRFGFSHLRTCTPISRKCAITRSASLGRRGCMWTRTSQHQVRCSAPRHHPWPCSGLDVRARVASPMRTQGF